MREWVGGPSWGGGEPWPGPQPPHVQHMCPSPGTRMCPHTDMHGHTCTPLTFGPCLEPPCPLPGLQGTCAWPATPPLPPAAGHRDPSPAQPGMPQPQGSRGVFGGCSPLRIRSARAATLETPVNGLEGARVSLALEGRAGAPLGARCSGEAPQPPPDIGGTWLFRCCPHPAPL